MSRIFHQLVSKSTALLFLYTLFPICFGLPCGDYANEKELRFTCTLDKWVYFEDLTIDPPINRISARSTTVLVDYFEKHHTALFLTAAHAVSSWDPIRLQNSKSTCVFMPHDVCYSLAPLNNFALEKQIKDKKGYANISIVCYDSGTNLPIESMYAYPVELALDNELPERLYLPRARGYEMPFHLDIAVVVAMVNDEFIRLYEAGSLKAIMLPPMQLDEDFIHQFTSTKIDITNYYKVRVGGSGCCDRIVCNARNPVVPLFSNFGIDQFVKLVHGHLDVANNETLNWRFTWPLTVEDGVISLKPTPCREFHSHAPACGLRSNCFGDSGGPVYLPHSEPPVLIGTITGGDCTHIHVMRNRHLVSSGAVLLTNTEVQTWYNKIKRLVESGVIPVNKTICDM